MFAVLRLVSLRELCDLLLNFSGFHAFTISFGGFDVRSGRKYGQSGSSGPAKMNINRGGAVLPAAQTVTVLSLHRCNPPLLCSLRSN